MDLRATVLTHLIPPGELSALGDNRILVNSFNSDDPSGAVQHVYELSLPTKPWLWQKMPMIEYYKKTRISLLDFNGMHKINKFTCIWLNQDVNIYNRKFEIIYSFQIDAKPDYIIEVSADEIILKSYSREDAYRLVYKYGEFHVDKIWYIDPICEIHREMFTQMKIYRTGYINIDIPSEVDAEIVNNINNAFDDLSLPRVLGKIVYQYYIF